MRQRSIVQATDPPGAVARGTQRTRTAGGFAIVAIVALLAYLLTMSLS
ncbi:hypothetical protein ACFLR0_02240 [Candidatus Bipolaricaulota bacterium]